jgi:DNA-binding MarR family transcriptional regulator
MAGEVETTNEGLIREADEVEGAVRALYKLLRRPFGPDIARSGLTVPQMGALEELAGEDGLSLKDLSMRMGLSHSTVSGIVDRLQRRGFVRREPGQRDRRYSRIFLSEDVKGYVREEVPSRRLGPTMKALSLATAEERERILGGVGTLRRLLEAVVSDGAMQHRRAGTIPTSRERGDRR